MLFRGEFNSNRIKTKENGKMDKHITYKVLPRTVKKIVSLEDNGFLAINPDLAARITTSAGCDMIITNGAYPERLYNIIDGTPVGTRFFARKD